MYFIITVRFVDFLFLETVKAIQHTYQWTTHKKEGKRKTSVIYIHASYIVQMTKMVMGYRKLVQYGKITLSHVSWATKKLWVKKWKATLNQNVAKN